MAHTPEPVKPVSADELRDLAEYLPDNAATHLLALAERQAKAEEAAAGQQAISFLALIEGLAEYDQVVASHLLVGLLRIAAGQKLLSVEQTALRIAGLAMIDENRMQMTTEGKTLLEIVSPHPLKSALIAGGTDGADTASNTGAAWQDDKMPHVARPFASLRFGQRLFEVADGRQPGSLVFRLAGDDGWKTLLADRSSAWDEIGGEILEKGIDLIPEYVMMHTMRLAVPEQGEGVHHFELSPLNWYIRISGDMAFLRTIDSDEWRRVPDDIREPSLRALGIRAAQAMIPNFLALLEPEAISWSRRMAHAAAVTPIMSSAA